MARTAAAAARKYKSDSKTKAPLRNYAEVKKGVKETIQQHSKSKNTIANYKGHIRRGREFLATFVAAGDVTRGVTNDMGNLDGNEVSDTAEDRMDPNFKLAFDGPPISCTPIAIAMYLRYKCVDEGCGKSTASALHAAFHQHYEQMAGDKYRGQWRYDHHQQEWVGNPVRCAEVEDMLDSCKNKDGEGERTHSRAITIQDMKKLHEFCEKNCPKDNESGLTADEIAKRGQILLFKALASTGFTSWTRNCETISLRFENFEFAHNRHKGSPESDNGDCWFRLNLRNRKNWQKRMRAGEAQMNGHSYRIYPQKDTPEIDMYSDILEWFDFYEKYLLRRPLQPKDFIFPLISPNGIAVHSLQPLPAAKVQKLISEMTVKAQVYGSKHFTTHCFRRGGAQYRFMFAPIGKRWTLARIRWWGGWAQGEHRDTLIKYLLDELYTYEEDHSNALCPHGSTPSLSHAGEHTEISPMTAAEQQYLLAAQTQTLEDCLTATFQKCQPLSYGPGIYPHAYPTPPSTHFHHSLSVAPVASPSPLAVENQPPATKSLKTHRATPYSNKIRPTTSDPAHIVPDIPRSMGPKGWHQVIKDWDAPDPTRSHHVALAQWDPKWHQSSKESAKYGQRRLIALEFINQYNRDIKLFEQAYPECQKGIGQLISAIRLQQQERGECRRRLGRCNLFQM